MMYYHYDPLYLLVSLVGLVVAGGASLYCNATFKKWSRVSAGRGMTGASVAAAVMNQGRVEGVGIEAVGGSLTDHYDPLSRTLRLSDSVHGSNSVAAAGVAAHEAGHAIQHAAHYPFLHLRTVIYPVTAIASQAAIPIFMLGLFAHAMFLQNLGILLFAAVVFFQLVTLPVEIDASRRALAALRDGGILSHDELAGARSVLTAAALTYLAAVFQALLTLLYLLMKRDRR